MTQIRYYGKSWVSGQFKVRSSTKSPLGNSIHQGREGAFRHRILVSQNGAVKSKSIWWLCVDFI